MPRKSVIEDDAEPRQHDPRVVGLGRLERRARRRRRPRRPVSAAQPDGEGAQDQEEPDALQPGRVRLVGRLRQTKSKSAPPGRRRRSARPRLDDEQVGRRREDLARLADAAQVRDGDADDARATQSQTRYGNSAGHGRGERRDARRPRSPPPSARSRSAGRRRPPAPAARPRLSLLTMYAPPPCG